MDMNEKKRIIDGLNKKKEHLVLQFETRIKDEIEAFETFKEESMEQKELEEIEYNSKIQVLKTKLKNLNSKFRSKVKYEEGCHKERMKAIQNEKKTDYEWIETVIGQHFNAFQKASAPDEDPELDLDPISPSTSTTP